VTAEKLGVRGMSSGDVIENLGPTFLRLEKSQ
jgi:hypothetical protein